jgi:hypothetical protein
MYIRTHDTRNQTNEPAVKFRFSFTELIFIVQFAKLVIYDYIQMYNHKALTQKSDFFYGAVRTLMSIHEVTL